MNSYIVSHVKHHRMTRPIKHHNANQLMLCPSEQILNGMIDSLFWMFNSKTPFKAILFIGSISAIHLTLDPEYSAIVHCTLNALQWEYVEMTCWLSEDLLVAKNTSSREVLFETTKSNDCSLLLFLIVVIDVFHQPQYYFWKWSYNYFWRRTVESLSSFLIIVELKKRGFLNPQWMIPYTSLMKNYD